MTYRMTSAPARQVGKALAAFSALVLGATAITPTLAQQPPAAQPARPPAAAPKPATPAAPATPAQRPATPAQRPAPGTPAAGVPATPATPAAPGAPAAPGQAAAPADQQVQLIYSPWTKFCLKPPDANAKQVCFTGKDARIESGQPVVSAVLIEPEGEARKVLRVTLPLGMQLAHGTRVIIDQGPPATGPYVVCFANGCMADYEANADLVAKFKKGQTLFVQAINSNGGGLNLPLPLVDFAKAYDGPPTDPKVLEEQQKKLQEELQRRANEARQKLEAQPPKQ